MTTKEIENTINQAVRDYIEQKDGVGAFADRIKKLDRSDVFEQLEKDGRNDLVATISQFADIQYYMKQYGYNPNDSSSIQNVIQRYYDNLF